MHRRTLLFASLLTLAVTPMALAQDAGTAAPKAETPKAEAPKAETPKADAAKAAKPPPAKKNPVVVIKTNMGTFKAELYEDKAPVTVKNFLEYVNAKHYDGTIFHRVIDNFMIQGGGYDAQLKEKPTRAPIQNEAANGLKNEVGTLAMARTMVPDSATAQFFVNVKDNAFLDFRDPSPRGIGYAVFGKVVEGMETVNKIKAVPTGMQGGMQDVPQKPVVIESIRLQK